MQVVIEIKDIFLIAPKFDADEIREVVKSQRMSLKMGSVSVPRPVIIFKFMNIVQFEYNKV